MSRPLDAFETAQRRARYGHKDWVVWLGRDGVQRSSTCTADAIKEAMRAVGTQGHFVHVAASTATCLRVGWRQGMRMLLNCQRGFDGPAVRT